MPKSLGGVNVMLIAKKMLKANYMLIRLLCVYRITKYVRKILL